ncbi:zinc finger protein 84 isoform X2 [Bicyclus anynana]|uniref:Zinc finger protein 84 isoform X2 n=1 Tax=Bicyclus anynana TaxID=110368 RepID=A0ABM3LPL6_BICAN|nr:zinc finger protein 84 isoform X2 [Bicyclus anynana]
MQCCVPFCENTYTTESKATGITFHELPEQEHLRDAWHSALGTQDHLLPDPAVVCSQHFVDDDFDKTNSSVRQINSNAVPSTLQMCMICLDTNSKLFLMNKYKLQEAYEQLTGKPLLKLCRRGNLKLTVCVMCAQKLNNFTTFRDLSLRTYSMMTDLVEQHNLITKQHEELMIHTTKDLKCNYTVKNFRANHCDLYIDHTNQEKTAEESILGDVTVLIKNENISHSEEKQMEAEEFVLGDVATVVMKKENVNEYLESAQDCDSDNSNNDLYDDGYSDIKIKLESEAINEANRKAAECVSIKSESIFECSFCSKGFVEENEYNEHLCMHVQNAASTSQVCDPHAGCSRDTMKKTKKRNLRLNVPRSSAVPVAIRLVTNNAVQATEAAGAIQKTEQTLATNIDLDDQSCQSAIKTFTEMTKIENSEFQLYIHNKPKKILLENAQMRNDTGVKVYSCETCNYRTSHKNNLQKHIRTHSGEKPYSCEICNFKTSRKNNLLMHIKTHSDEKPYSCEICNYKSALKKNFLRHMTIHTAEKPYSCEICNYRTSHKNNLMKHIRTHSGEKPYSCEICKFKTSQKNNLLTHIRTHSGEKPYSCEICNYKAALKRNLLRHMATHTDEKPYSCEICNYKSSLKSSLVRHMKTHPGEKPYSCEICEYQTTKQSDLRKHMRTHTDAIPSSSSACSNGPQQVQPTLLIGEGIWSLDPPRCTNADAPLSARLATNNEVQATIETDAIQKTEEIFEIEIRDPDNQLSLKTLTDNKCKNLEVQLHDIHKKPKEALLDSRNPRVKPNTVEKPFSCDICNYKCSQRCNLLQHMRIHSGEKPYSCETCNYKCSQKSTLLNHIKTHTGEKPYSCEKCNYKCARKNNLLTHIRTHSGEKPYSCEICNFKTSQKNNLLTHMKTHSDEKPYSCEICNYKASLKKNLLRHMVTHTGEKPYSCKICHYKSSQESSLVRHMKIHPGEKPYSCEICEYQSTKQSDLRKHMRTHTVAMPSSLSTYSNGPQQVQPTLLIGEGICSLDPPRCTNAGWWETLL